MKTLARSSFFAAIGWVCLTYWQPAAACQQAPANPPITIAPGENTAQSTNVDDDGMRE